MKIKQKRLSYSGNALTGVSFGLYQCEDILHFSTKQEIKRQFIEQYHHDIKKILADIDVKIKGYVYFSPREYNYLNDDLDFQLVMPKDPAKYIKYLKANKDKINTELAKNKSYDGYIATTIDNVDKEIEEVLNNKDIDVLCLSIYLKDRINTDFNNGLSFENFDIFDCFVYPSSYYNNQ